MSASPSLSIVLPCYNPVKGWQQNVLDNYLFISAFADTEIIIVNDGSTKNFKEEEIRNFFSSYQQIRIISYSENKGKGYALRTGVAASIAEVIIYTDIDFPYTKQSLQAVYNTLKEGHYNVVPGKRSDDYYTHLPPARVKISKFLRFLIRSFLQIPTDDTQCGLKGFDETGKKIFLQTSINRFLFDLEFILLSARANLAIKPLQVTLLEGITLSPMPWKILIQEFGNFSKIFLQGVFRKG